SRYAEIFNSIITSLLKVLGNTRIELNHPAFMQRPICNIIGFQFFQRKLHSFEKAEKLLCLPSPA
ncbi:hypothetical protein, partial [Fischerella sp. FACHB-380]|uniref:hypothetical protein n=1 Tax=Fischerella sp. FACHB-380 TaxID=2692799 RepID=UPI001A7EBC9B